MGSKAEQLRAENTRLREALARSVGPMQRANQLASLGLLTAAFAHEIRNPLVALRTFAQLLPTRWDDPEFRSEFARIIVTEIERVEALMRELLRIAHASADERGDAGVRDAAGASAAHPSARASLAEIVEGVLPLLRVQGRGKEVEILFEAADSAYVEVEPLRLRQVVMNLVLNAIDATPAGGSVTVTCASRDHERATRAVLRVRDSGRGIAPDHLPRIFEPFFTTREHGTGLGLAITRQIVDACGGSIRAENTPNAGATFTVELPASRDPELVSVPFAQHA